MGLEMRWSGLLLACKKKIVDSASFYLFVDQWSKKLAKSKLWITCTKDYFLWL